jgi:phosphoenolpyruvate-protein phosphotransferase (PTS system enzyme I)
MPDSAARCVRGTPVSPGLARGRLVFLEGASRAAERVQGSREEESAALERAIEAARAELAGLMDRAMDSDAGMLLAFQVEMLGDPVVTTLAFEAIAAGAPAERAWRDAMEVQVREYHDTDDLYFRARAPDLRDMRDRVLRRLAGESSAPILAGSIVVGADLAPSRFLEIEWRGGGIALTEGSPNSHVAMLARSRGVPMIIGLEPAELNEHSEALLDSDNGMLVVSPDAAATSEFESRRRMAEVAQADERRFLGAPAVAASGERIQVLVNIADVSELGRIDPSTCDGIGLVRTELMVGKAELNDEERQYAAYRRILEWAQGRPVTIRTLDAGGDKPIAGYTVEGEGNPFLGVRGVRLSLLHPVVLTTQLRALARAATLGPLKIMVPMVTVPRELEQVRLLLDAALVQLRNAGKECAMPELGMMVEVPAAALALDLFDTDFVSIGSNDLIQYVTACSRDSAALAALQDPLQPAVMRIVHEVVKHANARGIPASLCGDMASDVRCISGLLDLGLRSLSVAPAALARVKGAIGRHRIAAARG